MNFKSMIKNMKFKTILPLVTISCAIAFSSCAQVKPVKNNVFKKTANDVKVVTEEVVTADPDAILIGTKMINPETGLPVKDHYISPYKPYNPIVAKGFKSGQLAGDPSTIQTNPTTGKPDKSTMKIFKLP